MAIHGIYYHVIHVLTYAAALECGCLEPQPMGPVRVPGFEAQSITKLCGMGPHGQHKYSIIFRCHAEGIEGFLPT